jgi:hypothetical protein
MTVTALVKAPYQGDRLDEGNMQKAGVPQPRGESVIADPLLPFAVNPGRKRRRELISEEH